MSLKALIFDVDGTLADTEEAHRQAFNTAFRAHGLAWNWSVQSYAELLQIPGGKERLGWYIESLSVPAAEKERLHRLVPYIHRTKTDLYVQLIGRGRVRLRPGVDALIATARDAGLRLAIASTTTRDNVAALITANLGSGALAWFSVIATGDMVPHKKPAPDIYCCALATLAVAPAECVAFEDSEIGVRAAKAAGLFTVATPTAWNLREDFGAADVILRSLADLESSPRLGAFAPVLVSGRAPPASARSASGRAR